MDQMNMSIAFLHVTIAGKMDRLLDALLTEIGVSVIPVRNIVVHMVVMDMNIPQFSVHIAYLKIIVGIVL